MKRKLNRIIAIVLSICMCMGAVNIDAYAEELDLVTEGNNDDDDVAKNVESQENNNWDGTTTSKVYEGDGYRITYTLASYWDGGYNANIKIENISENTIHNWHLASNLESKIANIWNAKICLNVENNYVFKNAEWNQDIYPRYSVEFGFSANENFKGFPDKCEVLSNKIDVAEEDYSFEYCVNSDWGSGFTGTITITNNSEIELEDWVVEFDFDRTITNIWNGIIESDESGHYVIRNTNYNSNIAANQSVSFGFCGIDGSSELLPNNCTVYVYSASEYYYNIEDVDYDDTDGDGLPNFYERMIDSDMENDDTDGDGLPDGYEVFTLQSYPTKSDSDGDGIVDGDEDDDEDGLNNLEEYTLGINPKDDDTDGDGLGDKSELKYGMNPNAQDTLGDGIIDGDRKFNIECEGDSSDNSYITPHISIELYGNQIDSLNIEKIDDDDPLLNSSIPGYLGNAYDFGVEGDFNEATLSFELSDELLNTPDLEPRIYYWNEETQLLEELAEQYIEGNRICTKLEHFSRYILLAKNIYDEEAFSIQINAPTDEEYVNQAFDISFVLDESGSVSGQNYSLMKTECIELVQQLTDNDRIAVFTFDDTVRKKISFDNRENAIVALKGLKQNNGATAIYDAINRAVNEYISEANESATRIMILVTDGYDNSSSNKLESVTEKAKNNNIVIYTIGVGRNVNTSELVYISDITGGVYYSINSFSQLETIFDRVISEADLYKDSDNDGLSDYHEKKIAAGELKIGSGEPLKFFSTLSYLNSDSDGDGILDGDEIEIRKLPNEDNYYCYLYSNPCMADTDMDEYGDDFEEYIGTSPISKINFINTTSASILPINTFDEWKEMIETHSWNYIHNLVQTHIVKNDTSISAEFVLPVGRADLFRLFTGEIWEVKPASYAKEPKTTKAIEQLKRYVACSEKYKIGGSDIKGDSFMTVDQKYTVEYVNMNNGLIIYHFTNNEEPQKETATEKSTVKDEGYVYESQFSMDDAEAWGVIFAIVVMTGTVAEDVVTGGAGIINDGPIFSFLFGMIFK